ncbi:hypothetical protein ACGH2B_08715 [Streptomyces sp. BBFR2]|uniref:hypothetical protein n=1 Tax=Streptomyces sp. BBFR2 TaxID=3372854 RepID=UPI0037DA3BF8
MSVLSTLLHDATTLAAAGTATYTAALAAVALTSVLAPAPDRRRDARATLRIMVGKGRG